jgi:hypothetical protein
MYFAYFETFEAILTLLARDQLNFICQNVNKICAGLSDETQKHNRISAHKAILNSLKVTYCCLP